MATIIRSLFILFFAMFSVASHAERKNGFDLSDSLIPAEKIHRGGVPRDGIPSIDAPRFIEPAAAGFLRDKDRVIGVYRNGIAKAYPIRILNWHEIVNDVFADEAVVISYCPLCNTGMVFSAQGVGAQIKFGVSGLLYNSDVLLYDRLTGSLWSQMMGKAVSGKLKGVNLTLLTSSHTSWREWRERYPQTLVLSKETGFRRNYRKSPYMDYARSGQLYFPVEHKNSKYRNKELVLGITVGEQHKAYPFKELARQGLSSFHDKVGGKQITVEWIKSEKVARLFDADGTELPSVLAYWFAWYGFHPDTEIFRAGD